jgi:hypothetical protein
LAIGFSLVIGTVIATVQARHAEFQAQRAERRFQQVREITTTTVLDIPGKLLQIRGTIAVREQLIQTGLRYLNTLAEEAAGDESLQLELARGYVAIGELQFNTAIPSVGKTASAP